MSLSLTSAPASTSSLGLPDRLARRELFRRLSGLRRGSITIDDAAGSHTLGTSADLRAEVRVHEPRFFREAALGGTLAVAEAYIRGDWDCDDLATLLRIIVRNLDAADRLDRGVARLLRLGHRLYHWRRGNSRRGSRRNIAAHYDLGNDFFRLWLDPSLAYSSGIFLAPDVTMEEASCEKFDRVCRKLDLRPEDHLLEIGSGWGGLALHAAGRYGCRVTTTTISAEQYALAKTRIADAGLGGRVNLLREDYRDLRGRFDKLASIEMIEAVGRRHFDTFFGRCGELLKPDGSLVLQAIVMPERRYAAYLGSVDFIQRYVFPGGCLPSLAAMLESAGRTSDLRFVHAEDFGPHYAETLRRWRRAFLARRDDAARLGYPEEFLRLWEYYLCYCEAVFEERYLGVVQVQFDKPLCRRDPLHIGMQAARVTDSIPGA